MPLIKSGTLQPVSPVADTTVTFKQEVVQANPALDGVRITVRPGVRIGLGARQAGHGGSCTRCERGDLEQSNHPASHGTAPHAREDDPASLNLKLGTSAADCAAQEGGTAFSLTTGSGR